PALFGRADRTLAGSRRRGRRRAARDRREERRARGDSEKPPKLQLAHARRRASCVLDRGLARPASSRAEGVEDLSLAWRKRDTSSSNRSRAILSAMTVAIVGRSSSHFTRTARIFALE